MQTRVAINGSPVFENQVRELLKNEGVLFVPYTNSIDENNDTQYEILITDGKDPDVYKEKNPRPVFTIAEEEFPVFTKGYRRFYKIGTKDVAMLPYDIKSFSALWDTIIMLDNYILQQEKSLSKANEIIEEHNLYTKKAFEWQSKSMKPCLKNYDAYFYYKPAIYLSGDFLCSKDFDRFSYFVLGDVSNHGINAAMAAVAFKSAIEIYLETNPTASLPEVVDFIKKNDDIFYEKGQVNFEYNVHAIFIRVDKYFNTAEAVNIASGEVSPIIIQNNKAKILNFAASQVLAPFCENISNNENDYIVSFEFNPGDSLILYSDGISEAFCVPEMQDTDYEYSVQRLKNSVNRILDKHDLQNVHDLAEEIIEDLNNFLLSEFKNSQRNSHDDVSLLVLKRII